MGKPASLLNSEYRTPQYHIILFYLALMNVFMTCWFTGLAQTMKPRNNDLIQLEVPVQTQ